MKTPTGGKKRGRKPTEDKAQSEQFIRAAKELGVDESGKAFSEAMDALLPRAKALEKMPPNLFADLKLYPTSEGGRQFPVFPGWGCPCVVSKEKPLTEGWDGWALLGTTPINPGETRRVGFVFLSGEEAAQKMRAAGKFYLWEGKIIGEAIVIP